MESLKKVHHLLLLCLSLITLSFAKSISLEDATVMSYRRVYRASLAENDEKVEVGTRISIDVLHVPNPCDECRKPYGNCGVGLKCICHINECKDKVINGGSTPTPNGNIFIIFSLGLVVAFLNLYS